MSARTTEHRTNKLPSSPCSNMPDMMNLPQPPHSLMLRQSKESPRHHDNNGFPEYLKHTDLLGDGATKLKLSASNGLFHAVLKGRIRGTRYLLDRTASVNGRNDYGYSVLTAALHVDDDQRRDKLFRMLLERGADPLFTDCQYDRNVLHWACLLGRTPQVKILLKHVSGDIDLAARDREGHTALHHSVLGGHEDIVRPLVDAHRKFGVSVDVPDKLGLTPYLHAKRLGYRDVADYLHCQGQASQGHGDLLFRTPREWSQIGRFERQRAVEVCTLDAINEAKIKGKITHVRQLEDSLNTPRANITGTTPLPLRLPPARPSQRRSDRLSQSLPSLKEPWPPGQYRPSSANGHGQDNADPPPSDRTEPKPPKEAFVEGGNQTQTVADTSHNSTPRGPVDRNQRSSPTGVAWSDDSPRGRGSIVALSIMEMNSKGRHARSYRQSQFDESKAAEYEHILGSLSTMMDAVSQQQCKSFRQSVKYHKPQTPAKKKKKGKSNVSTLAVIFGRDKSGKKTHKKRSAKKGGGHGQGRKEKEGGGAKVKSTGEKRGVLPVLKVNGQLV